MLPGPLNPYGNNKVPKNYDENKLRNKALIYCLFLFYLISSFVLIVSLFIEIQSEI